MARQMNYSGMKFNYLTLLAYAKAGGQGVGAIWTARCDCGVVREVLARRVVHGQIRSCGKCELSRNLPAQRPGSQSVLRAAERKLYMRYIRKAADKSIGWSLSPEEFRKITGLECRYCGAHPDRGIQGSKLRYNGVDRVDTSGPYTETNCIPACSSCRSIKGDLNTADFLDKVLAIANHLALRSTAN